MDVDEPTSGAGADSVNIQVENNGNGNKNGGVLRENVRFFVFIWNRLVMAKAGVFCLHFLLFYESTFSSSLTLTDGQKQTTPFLIRTFVKIGNFHRLTLFDDGTLPTTDEQQLFAWLVLPS